METLACFRVSGISGTDDLERDERAKVGVQGTVGDSHRSAAEFVESNAVVAETDLVMLKVYGRRARVVRDAQKQAIETAQARRPTFERCATLVAIGGLILECRYREYPLGLWAIYLLM